MGKRCTILAIWLLVLAGLCWPQGAAAQTGRREVDLLLVIALDVSASVDIGEYELMREGLARALVAPAVVAAAGSGRNGSVAIAVVHWSGFIEKEVKIGWRRISGRAGLEALAAEVRAMKRRYTQGATDLGGAISYCRKLIQLAPFTARRKIINLAGDGPNNVNKAPNIASREAVRAGIVINALVITSSAPILAQYFREFVIGGKGAFVEKIYDYDSFATGMRRKLERELGARYLY